MPESCSCLRRDNVPDALRVLQTVLLRDPTHLEGLNNYGVTLMQQQHFGHAVTFFEKAIDVVSACLPNLPFPGSNSRILYFYFAPLQDPSQPYVWSNLACAYSGAGRIADAALAFK